MSDNQLLPLSIADSIELGSFFESLFREFIKPGYLNKLDVLAAYLKIIMKECRFVTTRFLHKICE